ncbi:ectonucleoside triphosphate diphosphohydrolase 6 isoform X3 [Crotalus tigris]|uniref:ectonucleoside triphosphate diphosphohydrolase 6 isoform X3 n=1 Tax=Crotalus tigris TaxID=88082 RepID=UPI00192F4C6E|nr:ectonucleoside triphosphate diphosphohydrolase 6 isoform X3 [Crotalus tigris]
METMKIPKLFWVFAIFTCAAIYAVYTKWNFYYRRKGVDKGLEKQLSAEISRKDEAVLYGIMFDAGSTGTRIHVFQFAQKPKAELPRLIDTTFKALKPGLSAYADNVDKVKDIFQESPFFIGNNCVSIMDGSDEGISAWITVNFLTDSLNNPTKKCVGMLDLGGGSTQITFRPSTETSIENSTAEHIISFNLFNTTYKLNSHSYLGFGLMSARLAILGGVEGQALKEGEELTSPCLSLNYQGEWEHAKIMYKIKGQKTGRPLFESCHNEISKVLNKKIHEIVRIKDLDFYAFSYYYELAVDAGLIDKKKGGILPVRKFESAAKKVCKTMEIQQEKHPFLCMDLTYISLLLKELGFPKNRILKLAQKINNIETSWALGAILHYMDSLHML